MEKIRNSIFKTRLDCYFSLFANCVTVKGETRGVIYDLQRENIHFIPIDLIKLLLDYKRKKVRVLIEDYVNQTKIIEKYFSYLCDDELLFFTKEPNNFPKISEKVNLIPNEIDFLSLEIDDFQECKIALLKNIDSLGVKELLIVQTKSLDNNFTLLEQILKICDKSRVQNIIFILPDIQFEESIVYRIKEKYKRLSKIIFFNSNEKINADVFVKTKKKLYNVLCRRIEKIEDFVVNIKAYTEAKCFNLYFNRRVYIDNEGNIKHSYDDEFSYGNIKNGNIKKIINSEQFQKIWKITKDKIKVCDNCEFRYVCPDNRIPNYIKKKETYVHKNPCSYDTKTNVWK